MGGVIASCMSMCIASCVCTACSNLCNACLGSTAPGTTGRKRSVLLLTISVVLALWFQYGVSPGLVDEEGTLYEWLSWVPGLGTHIHDAWYEDCERMLEHQHKHVNGNPDEENPQEQSMDEALEEEEQWREDTLTVCAGQAGVYRSMSVATLFFAIMAVATRANPNWNRSAWPMKMGLFLFCVFVTLFMHSDPLFGGWYLWTARLGAALFCILQQVILVDVAYNWNEDWVSRADDADRADPGAGSRWLQFIVATCVGFYVSALLGIALLYQYFDGCPGNVWIITLTLLGIVALTVIQLLGSEGSLLTSSIISFYVTYLAYQMVSKNPNSECNPQLGENDVTGIVIGLSLTAISLAWTGWAWTAQDRLNVEGVQTARTVTITKENAPPRSATSSSASTELTDTVNLDVPFLDPNEQPTQGLVVEADMAEYGDDGGASATAGDDGGNDELRGSDLWKLNVVMALISCWVAMILTGWGSGGSGSEIYTVDHVSMDEHYDAMEEHRQSLYADEVYYAAANPTVGRMNMAMIGISQWTCIGLYIWTLLAPVFFPDRDFS